MAKFIWPVPQSHSQHFGADFKAGGRWYYKDILTSQTGVKYLGHNGDDLAAPLGTPVKASADGMVTFEGNGASHSWMGEPAGICVLLDHGDVYTGYAHLERTTVNRGQKVKQGDVIGYSGQTGAATGPHLHFEFIAKQPDFNNGYVGRLNPAKFMEQKGDDDMISIGGLNRIYRLRLGRAPDASARKTYLGKMTEDAVDKSVMNSKEYKDLVAAAKKGKVNITRFAPEDIRTVTPELVPEKLNAGYEEVKEALYRRKK